MNFWQNENPKLFEDVKKLILSYPTLHLVVESNIVYLRGALIIYSPITGKELDQFSIEIEFPVNYPRGVPIVRETDGRIPKIADRHFNSNGTACMFFRDGRYKFYPSGSSIVYFIEKLVKNFFIWQIDYDLNHGKSTIGGWGHNSKGIFEFYFEILNTKKTEVVIRFLNYHTAKHIKTHWTCFCGSGRQLRNCHISLLKDLRSKVIRADAQISLKVVNNGW